jgi:Na+-translocating ferredoxin:NAD+ oxidoreductase RnfG subunit
MKLNKDGHVFTIAFTFVCTIVLVFPLTLAYVGTKPIADAYWLNQHVVKTLHSMGLPADPKNIDQARKDYAGLEKYSVGKYTKDTNGKDVVVFGSLDYTGIAKDPSKLVLLKVTDADVSKALQDNSYTGNYPVFFYVFTDAQGAKHFGGDFTGPGLWGNIALAVGISADQSQLTGLQVLFNVETPGLGGRIAEGWFTKQFEGLKPANGLVFNQSGAKADNGFDAIAGATISSTAVKDTINNRALVLLKAFIAQKGGN